MQALCAVGIVPAIWWWRRVFIHADVQLGEDSHRVDLVDHQDGAAALRCAGHGLHLPFELAQRTEGAVVLADRVAERALGLLADLVDGVESPLGLGLGPDAVG